MSGRSTVKAKDHPLSLKLAEVLNGNVAYTRAVVEFPGNERFKKQLLLRLIGGAAHFQSFLALIAQGQGITEKEIIEAVEIGEKLMDDAIKLAQDRTQARAGVVHARPRIGTSAPAAPAPLVDLSALDGPSPKGQ